MRKILFFLIAFSLIGAAAVFWGNKQLQLPVAHDHNSTYLEISRGSSVNQIVDKLAAHGIIKQKWLVLAYLRITGGGEKLKAGQYKFSSPITSLAVLKKLEQGQERFLRFTVIEGWTRWDIAAAMSRLPELNTTAEGALSLMNDPSEIRALDPAAQNLEGYLYPDTYSFALHQLTAKQVVSAMVERFKRIWSERAARLSANSDLAVRDLVTLASLVETEAKLSEERALVSSVIYNRLNKKMNLGIDSSVIYAAKLAGKWRNDGKVYQSYLDLPSPYNTRKYAGLPPGPIGSPGAASLEAALQPAQTDYLYYVREPLRQDGAHNFYADEQSFGKGVQALREWEQRQ
ncbi:MAG: endolytic transglycosylase MltG [Pyrinomonadaceae bacterium]